MDTSAASLMIWKYYAGEIREAYLDSAKNIALVIAQPGDVRVVPIELWEGAYTNPETSFGLADRAVDECREIHREQGGALPVVYFVVLDEGRWRGEVMPLTYMSKGGVG